MKTFNPEKELRKIQKGNKNKVIFGIMALLLIIAIGSSYALYQIRYSKQIIYTTVAPFNKRDVYLAVKVNGEYQDKFPDKTDNYAFSGYECDGNATVTFDPDKWIAYVGATGPDKCTIKFGEKNINYDEIRKKEDVIVDETNDANLRYIGATPNNYIWFNCLKYDDLTKDNAEDEQHQCEKWRIIGIMNNMTIVDEETQEETPNQSLIKIIRADSIGNYSWDNKDTSTGAETEQGSNDWTIARLMKLLNPGYEEEKGGSLYWNVDSGECYAGGNNATVPCNFEISGLKNDETKNMIENVKWNIGSTRAVPPILSYEEERGTLTYQNSRPTTWNGYIGLIYPSDYGYATNGSNNGTTRDACLTTNLDSYMQGCHEQDWLYDSNVSKWTLSNYWRSHWHVRVVNPERMDSTNASNKIGVFPTLYLKSNIRIIGGDGTITTPYILNV